MNFFTITNILLWPFFLGYGLEKCIHKQLTDVTAICIAPKLATTAKYSKQNLKKKIRIHQKCGNTQRIFTLTNTTGTRD